MAALVLTVAIMALSQSELAARPRTSLLAGGLATANALLPVPVTAAAPAPVEPLPPQPPLDAQKAVVEITKSARWAAMRCFGKASPDRMSLEVTLDPSGRAARVRPPEWLRSSATSRCFVSSIESDLRVPAFAGDPTTMAVWVQLR
jgi:hypothetical protein